MIVGDISLQDVDRVYRKMGLKELVILPWYQHRPGYNSRQLCGLLTGSIEEFPEFPGLSGFLEHFIVLPEAKNPLAVMQQMPKEAARLLRARGIARILLCIDESNPKVRGLDAWARRVGYTQYAVHEGRRWYVNPLT